MDSNTLTILASALQIPAIMKSGGRLLFSMPEDYQTAALVLGQNEAVPPPGGGGTGAAQFLTSDYDECFIFINGAEGGAWLGPVLIRPMSEGRVSEIIRHYHLTLGKKGALVEYYQTLRVISERQFYYLGKLAELLLSTRPEEAPQAVPPPEPSQTTIFSARGDDAMFEHPPYFMELEMTRLVTSGNMDSALLAMSRINTFKRAVLAGDTVRSLKNSLICDCTFLARAAIAGGVPPEDAFAASDRLILKIEETRAIPELEKLERQNLIEFISLVHNYNTAHFSKPIRDVIAHINRNLGEELRLSALARLAELNPNYLCALFHKETGEKLSVYIVKRRVEEAKFFLRYTDDSISDISSFYRFSSQSHFTQWFSRLAGMTPLQYRKRLGGATGAG